MYRILAQKKKKKRETNVQMCIPLVVCRIRPNISSSWPVQPCILQNSNKNEIKCIINPKTIIKQRLLFLKCNRQP